MSDSDSGSDCAAASKVASRSSGAVPKPVDSLTWKQVPRHDQLRLLLQPTPEHSWWYYSNLYRSHC